MPDSYDAFTLPAEDYARYRSGYPRALLNELTGICGLATDWVVADIGSGAGSMARLFLAAGHHEVVGVEPNREMRKAGERELAVYPGFRCLEGPAERAPLPDRSVDTVTVGQALHGFDAERARGE